MAQVTEAASRQIVQKISCPPPIGRPLKISPPKVEKRKYGTELRSYHYASFYADLREISVPRAKIHIFLYRGLTWGGNVPCYTFLERSRRANVTPHLTYNAATYRFRDIKIWDFWAPWGYPYRRDFVSGTDMHPRAKFHADQNYNRRN